MRDQPGATGGTPGPDGGRPSGPGRRRCRPGLAPFDVLGPSHGADDACLWAHPPRFVERPLLARPGAAMTAADRAVTGVLHAAVLGMVASGVPAVGELQEWAPDEPASRCTAVFDAVGRVSPIPPNSDGGPGRRKPLPGSPQRAPGPHPAPPPRVGAPEKEQS